MTTQQLVMTTEYDIGYHLLSAKAADERGRFEEQMSIVEFLRKVKRMEELPHDLSVTGLDDYLLGSEDSEQACQYIHNLLRDRVNYLMMRNPRIIFIVEELELWESAVLPSDDGDVRLNQIFHGSLEQEGAGWFSSQLNVTS